MKQIGCLGLLGGKTGSYCLIGMRFSVGIDKNVLELDRNSGCTILQIH